MNEKTENNIHREFELERMILFSDAVFAIAITLLVIEIKFPDLTESTTATTSLLKLFKPTIKEFFAFLLSFFFIGVSWSRHLKMFRYLKAYDQGVIFLNLLSLLFIVLFPFTASGITHFQNRTALPTLIYIANLMLLFLSNFFLSHYIFKHKSQLSIAGHEPEKNYIYLLNKYMGITALLSFIIVLATAIASDMNQDYIFISFISLPVFLVFARRRLKKFKPKKELAFGN